MSKTPEQVRFIVREIIKKYNVSDDEVKSIAVKVLMPKDEDMRVDYVMTYYRKTWGSCREWKLVVTDASGNYLPGDWYDRSSYRNEHRLKYTKVSDLPSVIKVYYKESPSCNPAGQYSFTALVEVVRE